MKNVNTRMTAALVLAMAMIAGSAVVPTAAHAAIEVHCVQGDAIPCGSPSSMLRKLLSKLGFSVS